MAPLESKNSKLKTRGIKKKNPKQIAKPPNSSNKIIKLCSKLLIHYVKKLMH